MCGGIWSHDECYGRPACPWASFEWIGPGQWRPVKGDGFTVRLTAIIQKEMDRNKIPLTPEGEAVILSLIKQLISDRPNL